MPNELKPCPSCSGHEPTIIDPLSLEDEPYTCPDCGGSGLAKDAISCASDKELRQWILATSGCRIRERKRTNETQKEVLDRAFGFSEGMMAVYDHLVGLERTEDAD